MKLSEELVWRGFVNQSTFDDITYLDDHKLVFYHGFDASADSQTIGNLAAMMFDKALLKHGFKGIILAGGSTSLIGDPGGKDSERILQSEEVIANNVKKAQDQLKKIFAGQDVIYVNNLDWTKDMPVLEFLRDIGKHFSMSNLVQRDYIANRMGEGGAGISYTEFSYTLLQGYDYLYLFDKYNCTLQLGGSDQWGNCLSGVDLIRRARGAETHVMTNNLVINQTTGKKFGKSEAGAVWLDEKKTSVYQFYQFWLNVDDGGVEYYMKIYTEMTKEQIDEVMAEFHDRPHRRAAQKSLAYEVTKLVHGENRANSVQKLSEVLFGSGEYADLGIDDFKELAGELKTLDIKVGDSLVDALVNGELASSKGEARRFLQDNAVYINGSQISLDKISIDADDFLHDHVILRRGKNKTVLLRKD